MSALPARYSFFARSMAHAVIAAFAQAQAGSFSRLSERHRRDILMTAARRDAMSKVAPAHARADGREARRRRRQIEREQLTSANGLHA